MWWVAFEQDQRVPLLTYVNLGIHEFGHFVSYSMSDVMTALMGSVAQVGVPAALALYFLLLRSDWIGAGLCLAWGATSALEVAVYVADAPAQDLELVGGRHDWAFILGPDGYDAIDSAGSLAQTIRVGAALAMAAGFLLVLATALRARPHPEAADSTSFATASSSPWAASATSGSAPRSASRPKWTPPS